MRNRGAKAKRRKEKSASPPRATDRRSRGNVNTKKDSSGRGGAKKKSASNRAESESEYSDSLDSLIGSSSEDDGEELRKERARLREQRGPEGVYADDDDDTCAIVSIALFLVVFGVAIYAYWLMLQGQANGEGNGNMNRHRRRRGGRQVQASEYQVRVSLNEFLEGSKKTITHERQALCPVCTGLELQPEDCPDCAGHRVQVNQQRDFFSGRIHRTCYCAYNVDLTLDIQPGLHDRDIVRLEGQGNRHPGAHPGDVVVQLLEREHSRFERIDNIHLKTRMEISLKEALLGFEKEIKHVNPKRLVTVSRSGGTITKPSEIVRVPGKGMPLKEKAWSGQTHGDLMVEVSVRFPTKISKENKIKIAELFD